MPEIGEIRKAKEIGYKGFYTYIWHACVDCGKERWILLSDLRKLRGMRCRHCACKLAPHRWKGGRTLAVDGYVLIKLFSNDFFYPMAGKRRYISEHRLVMAKHLNRCLLPWEVVHHKGTLYPQGSRENRSDNRLENLKLLPTRIEHSPSVRWQQELNKRDKRIAQLEARVTLVEAENVLLKNASVRL